MSNLRLNLPGEPTYEAWMKHLEENVPKTGRIGNNTYAILIPAYGDHDGYVAITYHRTTIVEFHHDGTVRLNSGGWRTSTTKNRLCMIGGNRWSVGQKNFEWYVVLDRKWDEPKPFEDGMTLEGCSHGN